MIYKTLLLKEICQAKSFPLQLTIIFFSCFLLGCWSAPQPPRSLGSNLPKGIIKPKPTNPKKEIETHDEDSTDDEAPYDALARPRYRPQPSRPTITKTEYKATKAFSEKWSSPITDLEIHTAEELRQNRGFCQGVLEVVNQLRTQPQEFKKHVLALRENFVQNQASETSYYLENTPTYKLTMQTKEGLKVIDETLAFLNKMTKSPPLTPLKYNEVLTQSSLLHAKCMQKQQFFGHKNTEIKEYYEPWDRIKRYCKSYEMCGENLWLGSVHNDPTLLKLAIHLIVSLFVDDGVADRGHRYTLVNESFTDLGIAFLRYSPAIVTLKDARYTFVMNFGKGIESYS